LGKRDRYRLDYWDRFLAERDAVLAAAGHPTTDPPPSDRADPGTAADLGDRGSARVGDRVYPGTGTGTGTRTRTGGGSARAAAPGPAPLGDLDASPSPSTSTTDTTADPDRGCPDHGWADPGRPCGGCADARKRRDAAQRDAEQAQRDAEQAQRDAYAAAVADAGPCEHGEPGGDVMRPGNRGPACEPCRLAWRESISRVPADRRRAAEPDQLDAEPTGPPADVADRLAVLLAGGRP
jgi:hypothetical protein